LVEDANVQKINAKFTYSSWHPGGKLLVFSANKIVMFFHSSRTEIRDVLDLDSLLAYYVTGSGKIKTVPQLSRKDYLETYPAWSPDGRFLYFCCAPKLWPDDTPIPPEGFDKVKYDLLRISYDITSDRWGELETVISSKDTALSITLPRISPDGRWLLLCMADYGCFNAYNKSSDLYLMDLNSVNQPGHYQLRKLDINSDESESWHCWSANSRWIVFSSKRDYGIFTRLYISYIDKDGNAYKPLILPQKDPLSYSSSPVAYNTPELIDRPVTVGGEKLAGVIRSSKKIPAEMPITMATPKAEETSRTDQYRQRE
jgi:Tol biopolymer transport system component